MATQRTTNACLAAIVSITALAGCSSPTAATRAAEWTEPAWFSAARADTAHWRNWWADCLAQHDVQGNEVIGDGWVEIITDDNTTEDWSATLVAFETCGALFDELDQRPIFGNASLDEAAYQRMLDTRECVIHQGFDIPEPPNLEMWIAMQGRWGAFGWINSDLTREEAIALNDTCPQVGWGSFNWEPPR